MAYRITNNTSSLQRTTGIVPASSDFTAIISATNRQTPSGGLYKALLGYLDTISGAYASQIGIFSNVNSNNVRLNVNGTLSSVITWSSSSTLQTNFAYVRKGNSHFFYAGTSLIATVTLNVSALTFLRAFLGGDGTAGDQTNVELAYYREWSAALSVIEMFNEMDSSKAIRTANLVADTPLVSDLNDISGNGNHWTETGTAGSFITNIPGSPVDVTAASFPYSRVVTTTEFNVANDFWFKFSPTILTYLGVSVTSAVGQTILSRIYRSDGTFINAGNTASPYYQGLGPGDYYIQLVKSPTGTISTNITLELEKATILSAASAALNTYAINDDLPGNPGTLWDQSGSLIGLLPDMPGGELGTSWSDGYSVYHDRYNNWHDGRIVVLDNTFTRVASVDTTPELGAGADAAAFANNGTDSYVLRVADRKLWKITKAGVLTDTGATIDSSGNPITAIGVNRAGTKVYWTAGPFVVPYKVRVWDIVGNVALPDLYTVPGITNGHIGQTRLNQHNGDILTLPDDSIVVTWHDYDTGISTIARISSTGTLIFSKSYSGDYSAIDHIGYHSHPTKITAWFFKGPTSDDTSGRFMVLSMVDGTEENVITRNLFSDKVNLIGSSGTTKFGPSTSCTFITANYASTVVEDGGSEPDGDLGDGDSSLGLDCCDTQPATGDTGVDPEPVGEFPPFDMTCVGGGQPDTNSPLVNGEVI